MMQGTVTFVFDMFRARFLVNMHNMPFQETLTMWFQVTTKSTKKHMYKNGKQFH